MDGYRAEMTDEELGALAGALCTAYYGDGEGGWGSLHAMALDWLRGERAGFGGAVNLKTLACWYGDDLWGAERQVQAEREIYG